MVVPGLRPALADLRPLSHGRNRAPAKIKMQATPRRASRTDPAATSRWSPTLQRLQPDVPAPRLITMLGEHDAASILKNYNPHLAGKGLGTDIRSIDSIIIPRYSNKQIEAFFDKSLGVFLAKHDSIAQLTGANKNAIITTQNEQ